MKLLGIAVLLLSTVTSCYCEGCLDFVFSNNTVYASCTVLPVLSSVLHWNYHRENHTADIAFRHGGVTFSDWVAWGLNVNGSGMIGSQAMVAFRNSTSGAVVVYTTPVSWFNTRLRPGPLSFRVPKISANFSGDEIVIFAALELPAGRTRFNHVWQDGYVACSAPRMHAMYGDNLLSSGSVDFAVSGESSPAAEIGSGLSDPWLRRKRVHGILNGLSWGVMMPIGAMSARYVRVFKSIDPAWFYLHVGIQTTAYLIGAAGWVTGLKLGHDSSGITHRQHRNLGITLFCLATLQVSAVIFRPKPNHKFRFYWNVYHHTIGYTTILLSILNVFEGLHILDGPKVLYSVVVIVLLAVVVTMEGVTWRIVLARKSSDDDNESNKADNNGHAA